MHPPPKSSTSESLLNSPETIAAMLGLSPSDTPRARTLAVVGLSEDPARPSHSVSATMQRHGYRIVPINPTASEVLGERSYASLAEAVAAGVAIDVVNVFRLPKFIPDIVDEMIALGLHDLWVQLRIVNLEAARAAEAAGIRVVMDRCILIEQGRLASKRDSRQ